MQNSDKHTQYFLRVKFDALESVLNLLRSKTAQSLGIARDPLVKLIELGTAEEKFVPLHISHLKTLHEDLSTLRQEIAFDFTVLCLPWQDSWLLERKNANLHRSLKSLLDPELLQYIPKTFDTIGSIAIIELDRWGELSNLISASELSSILSIVGEAILHLHKHLRTVLRKVGNINGEFRIREYEIIAGEKKTSTIHKENNCSFFVDPTKMFFSPRLSFERKRVTSLRMEKNGIIMDCFAGCGPYSIQIACNHPVHVYSIEKNPHAYEFLEKSIMLNKKNMVGTIFPFLGDFREFLHSDLALECLNKTDCIIMNLPESAIDFTPDIVPYVKSTGTMIIFYMFSVSSDPLEDCIPKISTIFTDSHLIITKIKQKRIVFSYSPNQNSIGIDLVVKKGN